MPERFNADLSAWLAAPAAAGRRARLQWLHQLRTQEYQQAASTLGALPQVDCLSRSAAVYLHDAFKVLWLHQLRTQEHLQVAIIWSGLPLVRLTQNFIDPET